MFCLYQNWIILKLFGVFFIVYLMYYPLGTGRGSVGKRRLAWRKEGSALLGKRVRRVFGRRVTGAEVLKWVSAESNGGMALWHVQHDDGDEVL